LPHFFTDRRGGESLGVYESLNLALHVGDDPAVVNSNREKIGFAQFMNQVHGSEVIEVDSNSITPVSADALITREVGLPLAVLCADCLPILIRGTKIVGAIHAGRKGLLNGIITETISRMRALGGENLVATIGPAICGKCYEVDLPMYLDAVSHESELTTNPETHCLDLKRAARSQLSAQGVKVSDLEICTAHDSNYFSYRRDGVTGRNAGVIVL
jgi:YfiH family protein